MGNRCTVWRDTIGWGSSARDELKAQVVALRPETSPQIPSFNIVVVGNIGSGKSSFINSINSVMEGRVSPNYAQAGRMGLSVTKQFYRYKINPTIKIYDTMGIEPHNRKMGDIRDILQSVDGHVPHNYTYTPGREFQVGSPGYIANPTLTDRPHCIALVINVQSVYVLTDNMIVKLQSLSEHLMSRRVPLIIILTNVDEFCKAVGKDVTTTFSNNYVRDLVSKISTIARGVPENCIFPVVNYAKRVEIDPNIDILLLYALRQMLGSSIDYLKNVEPS